ncbi:MAG: hypothetical protein GF353_24960 [Candidatus Lokiarchaeota archaeon]|nr:hypothetical protein [Candidatus Lokiarchaeota archaeon]
MKLEKFTKHIFLFLLILGCAPVPPQQELLKLYQLSGLKKATEEINNEAIFKLREYKPNKTTYLEFLADHWPSEEMPRRSVGILGYGFTNLYNAKGGSNYNKIIMGIRDELYQLELEVCTLYFDKNTLSRIDWNYDIKFNNNEAEVISMLQGEWTLGEIADGYRNERLITFENNEIIDGNKKIKYETMWNIIFLSYLPANKYKRYCGLITGKTSIAGDITGYAGALFHTYGRWYAVKRQKSVAN